MEASVSILFTADILARAAEAFGLSGEPAKLGDFENYLFELQDHSGEPAILRLTHSSHRSAAQLEEELRWLRHLAASDLAADVAACVPALSGEWVVPLEAADGSEFFASRFRKAPGARAAAGPDGWNPALVREWGAVTGRLHRASASYEAVQPRQHWQEEELTANRGHYLAGEPELLSRFDAVFEELERLPRSDSSYGLIHGDIHHGNFHAHEGKLTVFDFDDAEYNWFVHDLAIPLYYALSGAAVQQLPEDEREAYAAAFFRPFYEGYASEHELDLDWLERVGLFMRMRDLVLYTVLAKKLDESEKVGRMADWIAEIRARIVAGEPISKLDFRALAGEAAAASPEAAFFAEILERESN
ncbi:phosphotransferase [Paenibacillus albicereus]|uniref:Phosphotransferase n=1 Tax=Paenibacillus albicereus TaxID=2726185 RepID=A0A6H2GTM3_9BACL|nr:phosphotransferase [Paenibacillus albicereus]QJC50742.1 phosphotransferase [Paenibacillus albicereus]